MKRKRNEATPTAAADLMALAEYVERFSSKTVVLLGDFVADAFQSGDITRVSREAPVLILRHRETQMVPGGGANAANNFVAMGAKILPITVGFPFGVSLMVLPPNIPLPSKIVTRVLEPINIRKKFGKSPDIAEVDAHVREVMQAGLDELAAARRFPVLG